MRKLVTGKEMKLLDQNTCEHFHVDSLVLMEQAAMVFVQEFLLLSKEMNKVLVLCGSGNNGGDGIAIARLLNQKGIDTDLYRINSGRFSAQNDAQYQIYKAYGYGEVDGIEHLERYDCILDGVFGIGLSKAMDDDYNQLFEAVNSADAFRVAIDIPSGIHADSGEALGVPFQADATITFSYGKVGLYLWPGAEYAGKIVVAPIGITDDSWLEKKHRYVTLQQEDLCALPKRIMHSNKGTYGKLLIIAGSSDMAGSAALCTKAALRMGTGLVKLYTPESNRNAMFTLVPEAILSTYAERLDEEKLLSDLKWADAVVMGPGIGTSKKAHQLVQLVFKNCAVPLLLDADALNIVAENVGQLLLPHTDMVVTPHLGEMSRLIQMPVSYIQNHITDCAQEFANQYNVVCVLKDFHTITAEPYGMNYINLSGNSGMATAGSGDVLSGMIGALMAQGKKGIDAAALGVYVHGLAGDAAASALGATAMIAGDIVAHIPQILP